jgi:hypothetical protein
MITSPPGAVAPRPTTAPPAAMPQPRNATVSNPVVPQARVTASNPAVPRASTSNRGLSVDIDSETDDEDGDHTTVSIENNPFHRPQR